MYKHLYETEVAADPQSVWDFHVSKDAFSKLNPPSRRALMLTNPPPMANGAIHRIQFKLLGFIPIIWEAKLEQVTPPYGFTDQATKSPFKMWRHRHDFEPTETGTIIRDNLVLAMPFGKLGKLAYKLWIKKQIDQDFAFRHSAYRQLFGLSKESKQ